MADQLPRLLVLRLPSAFTHFESQLSQKFHLLKAWESPLPTADFLATNAASVKVILCAGDTPVTADILHHLPSLQLIVATTAGLNHIDLPECRRRSISITNAGRVFSQNCADLAVGLLIDVLRRISAANRLLKAGFLADHRRISTWLQGLFSLPQTSFRFLYFWDKIALFRWEDFVSPTTIILMTQTRNRLLLTLSSP